MATWTNIPNSSIEPGKPIRSIDGIALRDNPIAIAQKSPGAPRIIELELSSFERITAGDQIRSRQDAVQSTTSGSFVFLYGFNFFQKGSIRLRAEIRRVSGGTNFLRIYRNRGGSVFILSDQSTTSPSFVQITVDIDVIPGDRIFLEHRNFDGVSSIETRNIRFSTNGEDLFPTGFQYVEGNRAIS